ncbi:MAG: hypothetical protein K2G37_05820, partial [Clostridia bacterium]|nr:hypothetical protein [Clostridia bacterium]
CILIAICLSISAIYANGYDKVAYADSRIDGVNLEDICQEFTESEYFIVDNESHSVSEYEDYINKTFDVYNYDNRYDSASDEWISSIVPIQLFQQQAQDFLYIGKKYGFYFNYDKQEDRYLIYLMLHEYDGESISGHIYRTITPLYYEKYKFNKESGRISLEHVTEYVPDDEHGTVTYRYYQKYSNVKNVYLKNVAFNGSLYNLNSFNIDEVGYDGNKDNGGYFIGGSYLFKGVSTQSGKTKFISDTFKIALGVFGGDKVGAALAVADMLIATANGMQDAISDFRNEVTNEYDYSFSVVDIEREEQIKKYGHLLKDYVSALDTPNTSDGVLFGTKRDSYVQSAFYFNFANQEDKENTGFVGKIKMDIVEENGNLLGSTVSDIASNIESNGYYSNIFDKRKISLVEDEYVDVYTLAGRNCQMTFDVPDNGVYTIETFGSVKNEFDVPSGQVYNKEDGINQKLIVELKRGDIFTFSSKNVSGDNGIYKIKVEFTPDTIELGETKTLSIAAGQREFLAFYNSEGAAFNYSIGSAGAYEVILMLGTRSNVLDFKNVEYKTSFASPEKESGKYLIGIRNNENRDVTIDLSLSGAKQIEGGQADEFALGHGAVYEITPLKASCEMNIGLQVSAPVNLSILSESFASIKEVENTANSSLTVLLEEGKKYFVFIESSNMYNKDAILSVAYNPTSLALGSNEIINNCGSIIYKISLKSEAEIRFDTLATAEISLFDNNWNEMEDVDGFYDIQKGEIYYIVFRADVNKFGATVSLNYTDDLTGNIGNNGFRYIRFVPEKSDYYNVSGVDEYAWYDNFLRPFSGKLYAGDTYYLMIKGDNNAYYDIEILRNYVEIVLRANLNLSAGLYKIDIDEAGIYTISTTKANGANAFYDVIDSANTLISAAVAAGDKYNQRFDIGSYFIEITSDDSIGLLINKLNADDSSLNNILINEVEQSVVFVKNSDNNFVFTAPTSGEYYFKIAYASTSLSFDVTAADSKLNKIATEIIKLGAFSNDTLNKRYGIKMELEANKTYYINIYYTDANVSSLTAEVLIGVPSIIKDVYLYAADYDDEITVINNGIAQGNQTVSMGRTYVVTIPNVKKVNCQISGSTMNGICSLSDNKLTVNFDSLYEGEDIYLMFVDDTDSILVVGVKVNNPYYVRANYNRAEWNYSIELTDRYGNAQPDRENIKKINLTIGDVLFEGIDNSYFILTDIESCSNVLKSESFVLNSEVILEIDGNNYTVNAQQIVVDVLYLELKSNMGVAQGSDVVVINVKDDTAVNSVINISNGVKTMIIFGNQKTVTNGKFKFNATGNFLLFLVDYNSKSTSDNESINLESVTRAKVYSVGENNITGYSKDYLVKANDIEFWGNGTLKITGDNGVDGASGVDASLNDGSVKDIDKHGKHGTNGTGALECVSVAKIGDVAIILRGGNGGNGGNGGYGGDGEADKYANEVIFPAKDGTDGGNGGRGGNGGARGLGCKANTIGSGIAIIDGSNGHGGAGGNGGRGGDGSNGISYYTDSNNTDSYYALSKSSSAGGNGGNGGNAGICGGGGACVKCGNGGNGGRGGDGGDGSSLEYNRPSSPIPSISYSGASHGGNGGRGGNGGYIGGEGGRGGNGGHGAKGQNASLFSKAEDGYPGARGGNGGNGGNGFYYGAGGSGGRGGIGGEGGNSMGIYIGGSSGTNGDKGIDGANGDGLEPSSSSCVAKGTLITLADGTQAPVESLTGNELLLVWNMFTGKFDVAPILFIDKDAAKEYEVINLYFSDGTSVKVIDEHGFWDYDLNRYVFLRNDASKYLGHWFNKQTTDADGNLVNVRVQLTDVVVQKEFTSAWSPVTYGHLCYYVNGMLSMPGATTGLINIFDVDPETMKIDQAKYLVDIEEYGLFTYEEFASICPVPEEVFEAFGGKYLKVAIGKGLTSIEELETLIARYSQFWETN